MVFVPRPLTVSNAVPSALERMPGNVASRSRILLPTSGRFSICVLVSTSPTDADDSRNMESAVIVTSTVSEAVPTCSVKSWRTCPAYGRFNLLMVSFLNPGSAAEIV